MNFNTYLGLRCLGLLVLAPVWASAQLLSPSIVEDFNYSVGNGGSLNGVAVTATGGEGNWTTSGVKAPTYSTTDLNAGGTFAGVNVGGGSINFASNTSNSTSDEAGFQISVSSASSTLYGSFLFQSSTLAKNANISTWVGVTSNSSNFGDNSALYVQEPVGYQSTKGYPKIGGSSSGSTGNTVGYTGVATTYIDLWTISGLGTTSQTSYQWILTAAQYNTFYNAGNITTSALNAATIGTAAGDTSAQSAVTHSGSISTLTSGTDYLVFGEYDNNTTNPFQVGDVEISASGFAVIPEPPLGILFLLGGSFLLVATSRRTVIGFSPPSSAPSSRS